MGVQGEQLEQRVSSFDWKEWVPIAGLYFVLRNIARDEDDVLRDPNSDFSKLCYNVAVIAIPFEYAYYRCLEQLP